MPEHFHLSLRAAADLGVATGSWHVAREEIASAVLAAPAGFTAGGSRCPLLLAETASQRVARSREALLAWTYGFR